METNTAKKRRPRVTLCDRAYRIKDLAGKIQAEFASARKRHRKMTLDPADANALLTHMLTLVEKTGVDPFEIPSLASEASLSGKAGIIEA